MDQLGVLVAAAVAFAIALAILVYLRHRRHAKERRRRTRGDPFAAQRRRDDERIAQNRRPYDTDAIPPALGEVTVVQYHYSIRDEEYAAVYLMPKHFSLPSPGTPPTELFALYWNMHADAIWAWRGDNVADQLTNAGLVAAAKERSKAMLDRLAEAGWQVSGRDALSLNLWAIYLTK